MELSEGIQRFIISTPARFTGSYTSENIDISHCWFGKNDSARELLNLTENPYSRSYYTVSFRVQPPEKKSIILPTYLPTAEYITILLAILFGKRFDNHGFIEHTGDFQLPYFSNIQPLYTFNIGVHNFKPRPDLGIPLILDKAELISDLLTNDENEIKDKIIDTIYTAGKFYLLALQNCESDQEISYLHLVNAGEVLSNFKDYNKDELLDETIKDVINEIDESIEDSDKIIRIIKSRLYQVRSKFELTLSNLLSDYFFTNTESKQDNWKLKKKDIGKRLKAAYDLRSEYLHGGLQFGNYTGIVNNNYREIHSGHVVYPDSKIKKVINRAPTFLGLERIIRFSLIRFIHKNCCSIDPKLD